MRKNFIDFLGTILLCFGDNWRYMELYSVEHGFVELDLFWVAGVYAAVMFFAALWRGGVDFSGGGVTVSRNIG